MKVQVQNSNYRANRRYSGNVLYAVNIILGPFFLLFSARKAVLCVILVLFSLFLLIIITAITLRV